MLPVSYFKRESKEMRLKTTTIGGVLVGVNHRAHSWSGIRGRQSAAIMEHGQASPTNSSLPFSQKSCHSVKMKIFVCRNPHDILAVDECVTVSRHWGVNRQTNDIRYRSAMKGWSS